MKIFIFLNILVRVYTVADCFSTLIYLKSDEIRFFGKNIYASDCNITFLYNGSNQANIRTFAAFRSANINKIANSISYSPVTFEYSKNVSFIAQNTNNTLNGYIIFEDGSYNCPLESISKDNPFKFENETQILYLTNTFDGVNFHNGSCKWQFIIPDGYGFKTVIEIFDDDADTQFTVKNTSDILINKNSVKINHPVYNEDSYIQFYLFNRHPNLRFQASVSVVLKNVSKTTGDCQYESYSNSLYWWKLSNSYDNNQMCTWVQYILPGTEVTISLKILLGDHGADYVGYYDSNNNFVTFDLTRYLLVPAPVITGNSDGTIKSVQWKFESDGSIIGGGFEIEFEVRQCSCASGILPCGKQSFLMAGDVTDDHDGDGFYCSNMQCNFSLEPCETEYTILNMYFNAFYVETITTDTFKVISNGIIVFKMQLSLLRTTIFPVILKTENFNSLNVTTVYSDSKRSFWFQTSSFTPEKTLTNITLSRNNPIYTVNGQQHRIIYFEIDDDMKSSNYTFIIHRYNQIGDKNIYLYSDDILFQPVKEICDTNESQSTTFYTCAITNYKRFIIFTLFQQSDAHIAAVELKNIHKQCVFSNKVFHQKIEDKIFTKVGNNLTISTISSPTEQCSLIFLIDIDTPKSFGIPVISHAWTTSESENVKIYTGESLNLTLMSYNSTTQKYWNSIVLSSPMYFIDIPKNSSIYIIITYYPVETFRYNNTLTTMYISEYPYYSMATTPCFGIEYFEAYSDYFCHKLNFQQYIITNFAVKFTATYLNLGNWTDVSLLVDYKLYYFIKIGDSYIFQNCTVMFYYTAPKTSYNDGGAIIFIEALKE